MPSSTLAGIRMLGRTSGAVKRLAGFKKDRHTVPDAVNAATQAFVARLAEPEISEEAEQWFRKVREAFAYKRRELSLALSPGLARLEARDFVFELVWALSEEDPSNYETTRTLSGVKSGEWLQRPECDDIFAGTFTHLVFELKKGVSVEAVIDAVESLPEGDALGVDYPSDCHECTLRVPDVGAEVRCTEATLELVAPRAVSPRELVELFGAVRDAFRLTRNGVLGGLV